MNNEEAKQLLLKYNAGQCSPKERALLEDWFLQFNEHEIDLSLDRIEEMGAEVYTELSKRNKIDKVIKIWPILVGVAASILVTVGIWKFIDKTKPVNTTTYAQDIEPGGNKATLTLTDGRRIDLKETKNGVAINGDKISYLDGVAIDKTEINHSGSQTLTTPKGGQYQIILPDGTRVWLNAASSLKYPVSFSGRKERRVQLTGEAYFEVKKLEGAKMPFIVVSNSLRGENQEVEVLGTHFNINTYNPNKYKTTLVEGSVKVSRPNGGSVKLKPGDQSILSDHQFATSKIDPDIEVAWKNGKTAFENADINTVMLMLTHWYDVEVKYEGKLTDARFSGVVSRSRNISAVLQMLESTKEVHFKIKGKEITVMN